jgi:hypothetical protein
VAIPRSSGTASPRRNRWAAGQAGVGHIRGQHVGNSEIAAFAQDKVDLPKDKADEYRAQPRRLRKKLEGYLGEHPDFTLTKMLFSGSLAKGSALRSLNDIDVAC